MTGTDPDGQHWPRIARVLGARRRGGPLRVETRGPTCAPTSAQPTSWRRCPASTTSSPDLSTSRHVRPSWRRSHASSLEGIAVLRNLAAHGREDIDAKRALEFVVLADAVLFTLRGGPAVVMPGCSVDARFATAWSVDSARSMLVEQRASKTVGRRDACTKDGAERVCRRLEFVDAGAGVHLRRRGRWGSRSDVRRRRQGRDRLRWQRWARGRGDSGRRKDRRGRRHRARRPS